MFWQPKPSTSENSENVVNQLSKCSENESNEPISRNDAHIHIDHSMHIDEQETSSEFMYIDEPETLTDLQNLIEIPNEVLQDDDIRSETSVEKCQPVLQKSKDKHKTGFNEAWRNNYPWLKVDKTNEKEVLFCTLCTKWHKDSVTFNNSPWLKSGYLTVRLDKVREHSNSHMHKKAVSCEANSNLTAGFSEKDPGLETNPELVLAIESAFKCMKFLIDHNLPHHSLYEPFVNFCIEELKSPILLPLKKAKNCSYTSHRTVDEFLEVMASTKEEELLQDIKNSPCFSILADETSDVTNRKHMAVAVKYLKDGNPKISFVKDCHLNDGKSETIFSELVSVIDEYGGFDKISGFTSDGASAMVGNKEGVATKLKKKKESIITINCMNHRLALASKDSFESQNRFRKIDEILTSTYKYYKYSPSRTNSLLNAQYLFCNEKGNTTLKRVGFTRWLSHQKAVDSIRHNYNAILNDLENTVSNGENPNLSGPSAKALLKIYKSFDFFQGIHFLCDVLNEITKLNLVFQAADVDIANIQPSVDNTLANLKRLKRRPGGTLCKNLAEKARSLGIIAPVGESSDFVLDAKVFIDNLVQNISTRMENSDIIAYLSILDLRQPQNKKVDINSYGNSEIIELAEFFKVDEDDMQQEWLEYKEMFLKQEHIDTKHLAIDKIYSTIIETEKVNGEIFPLLKIPLAVACTLPISNAEVERIFSQIKLVLTDRRTHLKFEHVNQLMIVKLNDNLDLKSVVDKWRKLKNRRLFS